MVSRPRGTLWLVSFEAGFPNFEPGTHLALIAYDTEGLGRRSGDEMSFDTVLNTRLFRPVLPIKYRNNITSADGDETLQGQGVLPRRTAPHSSKHSAAVHDDHSRRRQNVGQ